MFKIGIFSKMNRVTVKALRHYDDVGLLKPCYVDRFNGYRYYSGSQIARLHRILALKQIGFSIAEIDDLLKRDFTNQEMIAFLVVKNEELSRAVSLEQERLGRIQAYLQTLSTESNPMNYDVIIKELPEVVVASMRKVIPNYGAFNELYPLMGKLMYKHGVKCAVPGYCFTLYHDGEYKEKNIDVEICEAVDKMYPSADGVEYKKVAAVPKAASTIHTGPYTTIGKAYAAITEWVEKNGYEIADLPRESYIDGIWNKENPEEWVTEIQIPVRPKK